MTNEHTLHYPSPFKKGGNAWEDGPMATEHYPLPELSIER